MSNSYSLRSESRRLALEALTLGLAYGAGLCLISVCLLASFRPDQLAVPYWNDFPTLRSDTCGILSFSAVAVLLPASKFLRLRRESAGVAPAYVPSGKGMARSAVLAIAETGVILGTIVTIYLSVNDVTHPVTMSMASTHLAPWPTEGTLRVIGLFACVVSVSVTRFLRVKRKLAQGNRPGADITSSANRTGGRHSLSADTSRSVLRQPPHREEQRFVGRDNAAIILAWNQRAYHIPHRQGGRCYVLDYEPSADLQSFEAE